MRFSAAADILICALFLAFYLVALLCCCHKITRACYSHCFIFFYVSAAAASRFCPGCVKCNASGGDIGMQNRNSPLPGVPSQRSLLLRWSIYGISFSVSFLDFHWHKSANAKGLFSKLRILFLTLWRKGGHILDSPPSE